MTLPRIGMHMDAHNNDHPSTPHATAWHGGMAGAQAGRGEMRPVFPSSSPSPLPPPQFSFLLGFWVHTPSTTLLPAPASSPFISSPCLVFPQSCCSVCHCMSVILTTHSHNVLLFPSLPLFLPLHSQHASRLHLGAMLHPHGGRDACSST